MATDAGKAAGAMRHRIGASRFHLLVDEKVFV